jgi:hypothetical protein
MQTSNMAKGLGGSMCKREWEPVMAKRVGVSAWKENANE